MKTPKITHVHASLLAFLVAGCASSTPVAPTLPVVVTSSPVAVDAVEAPRPDENDPLTHVEKLQDPRISAKAVSRLIQFFEDAMTRDNKDPQGPNVKPVLDKIVEPLSLHCVAGDLDEKTQSKVVRLLADARDARGAPCLIKTLKDYKPENTEEDARVAARGVAAMKSKDAAGPLFDVFSKLSPSKPKGSRIYRDINEAMVAMSDPSWEASCITTLSIPIQDRRDIGTLMGEVFRQVTCARILGNLKSEKGIPNLIKLVLSPLKADTQSTAVNALIKIGKPAIAPLVSILQGTDKELIEYAKREYILANTDANGHTPPAEIKAAPKAYVSPVAVMLGSIGCEEAIQPMMDVMAKADAVDKVVVARELLKLPITPAVLEQVKRVYEKTSLTLTIPPGMGARGALLEQLGYTFDPQLVSWLVKDTLAQKGEAGDLEELRGNAFVLALKLAKFDQIREFDKIGNLAASGGSTIGKGYEREVIATKKLLTECRDDIECYLAKLIDPTVQSGDKQFIGIKSAYMVGILGGPDVRAEIVERLPNIIGGATRFVSIQVIDHHSPKGDVFIAGQLQKMFNAAEESKNAGAIAELSYFRQFAYRLEARAR
jgi:HEAT repeat protein